MEIDRLQHFLDYANVGILMHACMHIALCLMIRTLCMKMKKLSNKCMSCMTLYVLMDYLVWYPSIYWWRHTVVLSNATRAWQRICALYLEWYLCEGLLIMCESCMQPMLLLCNLIGEVFCGIFLGFYVMVTNNSPRKLACIEHQSWRVPFWPILDTKSYDVPKRIDRTQITGHLQLNLYSYLSFSNVDNLGCERKINDSTLWW